jgi:hypothetical protein
MGNILSFRFTPQAIWPTAGFVLLCGIYYFWGWSRVLGDFGGDNAFYLLIAQYFSPWSTASDVAVYFFTHSLYPPLYPFALALFGGGESLLAAHVITITFLLLAFVTLYLWLRSLDVDRAGATLIVLLFALLPGTYMHALSVLSENLFLFLTLVCIASVSRFEADRRSGWLWLAAISLASTTLTRSAGVALLAAFMLYLIVHRPVRSWPIIGAAATLPMILWNLFSHKEGPGYLGSLISKYGPDAFAALFSHLKTQAVLIAYGWISNFTASRVGFLVMAFAGVLALMGMAQRIRQRRLDGYYAAAYLLLILAWPYPSEAQRFVLVIAPVLLVQAWLLVERLPKLNLGGHVLKPAYILMTAVALVAIPNLLLTGKRFMQELPHELAEFRRAPGWYAIDPVEAHMNISYDKLLVEHLSNIRDVVPMGECLYGIKPSIIAYYTARISVAPPRPQLDDASFNASLGDQECRFYYLVGFASPSYPIAYYPLERLRDSLAVVSVASSPSRKAGPVGILAERIDR